MWILFKALQYKGETRGPQEQKPLRGAQSSVSALQQEVQGLLHPGETCQGCAPRVCQALQCRLGQVGGQPEKKKRGKTKIPCREEKCGFKTYDKRALEKHIAHKHPKEAPIKKEYKCDGCGLKTTWRSRMMRHRNSCVKFIGNNTMRVVQPSATRP